MENQPTSPIKNVSFTDVRPATPNPATPSSTPTEPTVQDEPPATPQQPVVSGKPSKSGKGKKVALIALLCVLVAAGAFGGAYYWQDSKNKETAQQLQAAEAKVTVLEQQASKGKATDQKALNPDQSTATSSPNPDLIAGDVQADGADGKVMVTAIYKFALNPTAVWIEYGTNPNGLTYSSEQATKGLGAGEGTYATGQNVFLDNANLKPGTTYYYRTMATINGQTQGGYVASFTTTK